MTPGPVPSKADRFPRIQTVIRMAAYAWIQELIGAKRDLDLPRAGRNLDLFEVIPLDELGDGRPRHAAAQRRASFGGQRRPRGRGASRAQRHPDRQRLHRGGHELAKERFAQAMIRGTRSPRHPRIVPARSPRRPRSRIAPGLSTEHQSSGWYRTKCMDWESSGARPRKTGTEPTRTPQPATLAAKRRGVWPDRHGTVMSETVETGSVKTSAAKRGSIR